MNEADRGVGTEVEASSCTREEGREEEEGRKGGRQCEMRKRSAAGEGVKVRFPSPPPPPPPFFSSSSCVEMRIDA